MTQTFDKEYWESHWQHAGGHAPGRSTVPSPYLEREISSLMPGAALDAGCGKGAEAIWLANEGWQVTAADISLEAISLASERSVEVCAVPERIQWVEADLSVWEPGKQFDLVTTHYAHPAMSQLAFYERLSGWVARGGTLLIVGHLHISGADEHGYEQPDHEHNPPEEASATATSITAGLDATEWDIVTADELVRTLIDRAGGTVQINDVVVRATRRI
jgi:SAM-dependent methyltransferase